MKPDFRKSMIWLHTYSGLVIGWLLFTIFLTGTLSYFNPEITQWMKPELTQVSSTPNIINRSLDVLHKEGVNADRWRVYLPSTRTEHWYVQWSEGRKRQTLSLDEQGKTITPRDSASGNFFRTFHYTLQLRSWGGRYISGIASMFMLVAVFSGIFTHRRFFKDFFTLRLKKLSKALSDFHAIVGVVTIPFTIMICTTGIMVYVIMYMPFSANHYVGGERQLSKMLNANLDKISQNAPYQKPLTDFTVVQKQIDAKWQGENQIRRITFEQPFSQQGRIIVERVKDNTLSRQSDRLVFSSNTGNALEGYGEGSAAAELRRVFFGLHEAHFASTGLRWLLFILGLLSTALIATGLIIWIRKRQEQHSIKYAKKREQRSQVTPKFHFGYWLVERLNICGIAGLMLAITVYFYGNRILPTAIENRAGLEVNVFLIAWLLCALHCVLRPVNKAWFEQLFVCAIGCIALPLFDFVQDSQRLVNAINQFNITYLSVSLSMFVIGVVLLKVALWFKTRVKLDYLPTNLFTYLPTR